MEVSTKGHSVQFLVKSFIEMLETVLVTFWFLSPFLSLFMTIYILFFSSYWLYMVAYICWIVYDRDTPFTGGRRFPLLRKIPFWNFLVNYFPARMVKTAELPPDNNYLFMIYPHGLVGMGIFASFCNDLGDSKKLYPDLAFYSATLDIHFFIPFHREIFLLTRLVSCSKKSLSYILKDKTKGNAVILVAGGGEEALYTKSGEYNIILRKRKGFIKCALRTGTSLVPVINFGENELFDCYLPSATWFHKLKDFVESKTGFVLCLPKGRSIFPTARRVPIHTVVGKAIEIPKIPEPSQEEVDHYHAIFEKELIQLFENEKHEYLKNAKNTNLVIVG